MVCFGPTDCWWPLSCGSELQDTGATFLSDVHLYTDDCKWITKVNSTGDAFGLLFSFQQLFTSTEMQPTISLSKSRSDCKLTECLWCFPAVLDFSSMMLLIRWQIKTSLHSILVRLQPRSPKMAFHSIIACSPGQLNENRSSLSAGTIMCKA